MNAAPPGEYGPLQEEPGFHEKGGYVDAGFQATVNHFGGNLIVSATDVSIPSTGGWSLHFTRTHNSNKSHHLPSSVEGELAIDSPLGLGWTSHYGILWPAGDLNEPPSSGVQPQPQYVESSGARELFYNHDTLTGPISISSPGSNPTWISPSLKILRRTQNSPSPVYELMTPQGLKWTFEKLPQYPFFVSTGVEDAHGNRWQIRYVSGVMGYPKHPLVEAVSDGWNRELRFIYNVVNGRRRLHKITLGTDDLATYEVRSSRSPAAGLLQWHETPEGRRTVYDMNDGSYPGRGSIESITLPTGGKMEFDYDTKVFRYKPGSTSIVYAITSVEKEGYLWEYDYPTQAASGDDFTVTVTATPSAGGGAELTGTYSYWTYEQVFCDQNLWRVGLLSNSAETFNGTTIHKSLTYDKFQIANSDLAPGCTQKVFASRVTRETETKDGYALSTTYNDFDNLNFPLTITTSGGLVTSRTYHHVATNNRYVLGLEEDESVRINGDLVRKTERVFSGNDVVPNPIKFYRAGNLSVDISLDYHTTAKKAGELRRKQYGPYSETYEYANGVLESVDYAAGPDLSRSVNQDGTIASETRSGVTKTFTWDDDRRPEKIDLPGAYSDIDIAIDDHARTITRTQGTSSLTEYYDEWARLACREERIDSGVVGIHTWSEFNALGLPERETVPSGADPPNRACANPSGTLYDESYDVSRRVRSRNTHGDFRAYAFSRDASGTTETETRRKTARGATVERRVKRDYFDRILEGTLNGNSVVYTYNGTTQTIRPANQPSRTIGYDFFDNKTSESHPETGTISYSYDSSTGWNTGVHKILDKKHFELDARGRIDKIHQGTGSGDPIVIDRDYDPTYGSVSSVAYLPDGVSTSYRQFDALGQPRQVAVTIPKAIPAPKMLFPAPKSFPWSVPGPASPGFNRREHTSFRWNALPEIAEYQFQLFELQGMSNRPLRMIHQQSSSETAIAFSGLPSPVRTSDPVNKHYYCWRVRAVARDGEIGVFSPCARFAVGELGATPTQPPVPDLGPVTPTRPDPLGPLRPSRPPP